MKFRFWGVRGSIPSPGKSTVKYGGNTACVELMIEERNQIVILDAGTGIRELGNDLMARFKPGTLSCSIFLSHTHWDHVQGFPFFTPAFIAGNKFNIYGPPTLSINEGSQKPTLNLKDLFIEQMRYQYFPVKLDEMQADTRFFEIREGEFTIDGIDLTTQVLNHPVLCFGYRFRFGRSGDLVYCTDIEPYNNFFIKNPEKLPGDMYDPAVFESLKRQTADPIELEKLNFGMNENTNIVKFCKGARALIIDAQFTKEEYPKKMNWGHSRVDDAVSVACRAGVERLFLFHHDPTRSDDGIESLLSYSRELAISRFGDRKIRIDAASEGSLIEF